MADNRGLVTRKAFSNSLRRDLSERFEKMHQETDIPKSKLLDRAVEMLLDDYEKEGGKS